MKSGLLIVGFLISVLSLMFFRAEQENIDTQERFKYYKSVSKNPTTLKLMYLTWDNKNLPNFIKLEDYNKYVEKEKLIQFCFYIDSKNPESLRFNTTQRDHFKKKIPVEITGKFYKTKQFDTYYPNSLFEELRRINDLGFDTVNKDFTVLVID